MSHWKVLTLSAVVLLAACTKKAEDNTAGAAPAAESTAASGQPESTSTAPAGEGTAVPITTLQQTELKPGSGPAITPGKTAVVHYTGWLYSEGATDKKGQKFDSSVDRNDPFRFPVGGGQVIAGWDQGVAGMKVGEQRRLVIPAELGYGARGAGGVIPPGATLVFDVELLGIE